MECTWCDSVNEIRAQESGYIMGVICKNCGTKLGYIDYKEFNKILIERDYYKKEFYKRALTNGK
jgi:translation initiation factor 2 beta subunit (eIF-2beta)/eIF-5